MLQNLLKSAKEFGHVMGGVQSRILLGLLYFFLVTPFGLAVKTFSDPLFLRRSERLSNWISKDDPTSPDMDGAKKQF
jgi:hypothetical protein